MDIIFYRGRANEYTVTLRKNGTAVPVNTITKIEFEWPDGSADSDTAPDAIDIQADKIVLKLGVLDCPIGNHQMRMIVYSADHPEGVVWTDDLLVTIK